MVTLMAVGDSSGTRGRCDARCYNAKGPDCDCICQGKNHGVGLERAQQNVDRIFAALAEKLELEILEREQTELNLNQ